MCETSNFIMSVVYLSDVVQGVYRVILDYYVNLMGCLLNKLKNYVVYLLYV